MIGPVMTAREHIEAMIGASWMPFILGGAFFFALVVLPILCCWLAAGITQRLAGEDDSVVDVGSRYAYSLLPIGAAMWVAHYSFHLFTSAGGVVPAVRRFLGASPLTSSNAAHSMMMSRASSAGFLLRWEILCLDAGLLFSLYVAYRIGFDRHGRFGQALLAATPWAALSVGLFVLGVWILFQPMQMRDMMAHGN